MNSSAACDSAGQRATVDALPEAYLQRLIAALPTAAYICDRGGRILCFNEPAAELWGRRPRLNDDAELYCGSHRLWTNSGESLSLEDCWMARALRENRAFTGGEVMVERPDGSRRVALAHASPFHDESGRHVGAMNVLIDVTERRQAEAHARRTSDLLHAVADGTSDAVFVKDTSGRYLFFNEAAARFVGRAASAVLGQTDFDIFAPESASIIRAQDQRVMESGRVHTDEEELTAAGVTRTYLVTKAPYWDDHGNVLGVVGISRDITQRKQAERDLRASEERLRALINAVPDMIFRLDEDGVFFDCKVEPSAELIAPPETFLGQHFRAIMPPAIADRIAQHIAAARVSGELQTFEYELALPGGLQHWYEARLMVVEDGHTLVVARNVTDRKQLEEQFHQSQKMEAVGRLAGGVAHDFNNLLTIISGFSELLQMQLPPDSPLRASVHAIQDAGARAALLTQQLLAFSRKQVLALTVLDLNEVVRRAESMLRRVIGEDVLMAADLAASLPKVTVDRGQIEQVILNLVLNARDSMPNGGQMTIATRLATDDADEGIANSTVEARYVELSVGDTGHGMNEDVKARIFDPFFTTKEFGKGTGLGLAVVHGIVTQSGGRIEVDSRPGEGTRFRILLPAVVSEDTLTSVSGDAADTPIVGGNETILVVEDDEAVRQFAIVALKEFGFRVLSAKDGPSAIELVRREPNRIELLLSDVVMPELSGPELASILRRDDPQLKVLYVSGYADDDTVRHGLLQSSAAFLQKPYAPQSLVRKVREVLDDTGRTG